MKQKNNPWKHVEVDPARLKTNRFVHPEKEPPVDPDGKKPIIYSKIKCDYEVMPLTRTYALGVHTLRSTARLPHPYVKIIDKFANYIRSLTFKENIEARVIDYETLTHPDGSKRSEEERLKLFRDSLNSCTGMAYKTRDSTKFKIIPECKELILIDKDFEGDFLTVEYDTLQGIELDESKDSYRHGLTKDEALKHPAWIAAVENDLDLLKAYTDIIFNIYSKSTKYLGFYPLLPGSKCDELEQLRPLYTGKTNAYGMYNLDQCIRFIRVLQNKGKAKK